MTVAETSIEAYHWHRDTGRLSAQCLHILDSMQPGWSYSRRELIEITGLELSSICGRVNELLAMGLLEELAPRKCNMTGRSVIPVRKPPVIT